MSTQTYREFKRQIRDLIWPGGEPEKLVARHDQFFLEAMIDLQKWINPCLQQNNTTLFKVCNLYWERYKTVAEMPKGRIVRLYTIANDNWEDKVWYQSANITDVERWADRLHRAVVPLNTGLGSLPFGFKYAESATDLIDGLEVGRARSGNWAIHNRRLYVAPWLQSNETLVMEWHGQKYDWTDADLVDVSWWTPDVKEAVAFWVKWKHEYFYGDKGEAHDAENEYNKKRSDLMVDCKRKTEEQFDEPASNLNACLSSEQIDDDEVPAAQSTTDFVVCLTGDLDGPGFADVATAMKSHNPGRIILLGDISYGSAYEDLIGPNLDPAIVYPAIGNHDVDVDPTLADYKSYFAATLRGNKRYYSHVFGPFHFFNLNTDDREPDGGYVNATTSTQGSVMGEWLTTMAAVSTAKYKIAIGHNAPYTSDVSHTPGSRWMRWNYAGIGLDFSVWGHGHNGEHAQVSGFNYFMMGLGGRDIRGFGATTTGSIFRYNSDYAFIKLTGNCDRVLVEFIDRNNNVVYSYTFTK